jgi:hypothetical protein
MSLIADLLSKIKPSEPVRDVPPLLKDTIQRSSADRQNKKRLFILLTVAAATSIGIAAMYLISDYDRPDQLVRHAPVAVKPPPPIPESKMNPPPEPMPVEKERTPTAPGRKSEKKAETAGVSARKAPAKLPAPEIKPVRMEAASGEKTAPSAGLERKEDTGSLQKPDKQG